MPIVMKKIIFSLFVACICACNTTLAQSNRMRPNWTYNTPKAEHPSYSYYVSKGVGATEKEARKDAFVIAIKEAQSRIGVGTYSKEILEKAFQEGRDFNVVASAYEIPMKEVCFFAQKQDNGTYHYYQLIQIAKAGNITPQFQAFDGDCYDFSKAIEIKKLMEETYKDEIAERKQKQKELKKNEKKKQHIEKMYYDKSKYIAWAIVGASYPWNLVSGLEFRYGNIVGFGAYVDLGMDFTAIRVIDTYPHYSVRGNVYHTTKTQFRYAGGLKFFPYKGIFIDCGYGTIHKPSSTIKYSVGGGNEFDSSVKSHIRSQVDNSSNGILFHAGYNLVTDLSYHAGFFLGISAGASYDVHNKVFAPSINLKIGVAWGL